LIVPKAARRIGGSLRSRALPLTTPCLTGLAALAASALPALSPSSGWKCRYRQDGNDHNNDSISHVVTPYRIFSAADTTCL
jgi:hypothetical protein